MYAFSMFIGYSKWLFSTHSDGEPFFTVSAFRRQTSRRLGCSVRSTRLTNWIFQLVSSIRAPFRNRAGIILPFPRAFYFIGNQYQTNRPFDSRIQRNLWLFNIKSNSDLENIKIK